MSYYKQSAIKLAFIGSANWDLYTTQGKNLVAIGKPGNSASDSHFGDKQHIKRLIANGWFNNAPTEAGLEFLAGLHTRLLPNGVNYLAF